MNPLILLPYAFVAALGLFVATLGVLQYRLSGRLSPEFRGLAMVAVVGIGALLSVALTSRTLNEVRIEEGVIAMYEDYAEGFAASRWLSLALIAACIIEVARGWVAAHAAAAPDPARPVLVGMLLFYGGTIAIEAIASDHASFTHKALYVPTLLTAAYYLPVRRTGALIETARWVTLAVTLGSLIAIVVAPDFSMHRPDTGLIPGIDWRLYGLTSHANALGPIALLAIVFELSLPSRRILLRALHLGTAAAVLLLAQSRTAWVAAPVILAAQYLPQALRASSVAGLHEQHFRRAVLTLVGTLGVVMTVIGGLMAFDVSGFLERNSDLVTLTGRTRIWDITLDAWRHNLAFGYGAEIWGAERRTALRMFHVGHAHNQVMQTLGEAGLVGLLLLCAYIGVLFHAALRCFWISRGIVLALLMLMLVRFITEAPISAEGLLSWSTFLHLMVVLLACQGLRENARRRPQPNVAVAVGFAGPSMSRA